MTPFAISTLLTSNPSCNEKPITRNRKKRLSNNSANSKTFEEAASTYNAELKQNGPTKELTLIESKSTEKTSNIATTTLNETRGKTSQKEQQKRNRPHKEKTNYMVQIVLRQIGRNKYRKIYPPFSAHVSHKTPSGTK
ncbi:hypothetical protein ElyMa_004098300 [Elysia marginata]|uniref:Uncharacterized protein n=1 Tax=Elysia marginata TaxID=1093978 RepID=A0AAV4GBR5_9GAST|nr:hypothetical protein ElyMa_004098300 [Elysia marginata]